MYNDLLKIGPLMIHSYGLLIAIGIIAALLIGERRAVPKGLDGESLYTLTMVCVVGGILGAKILYVIVDWKEFLAHPLESLSVNGFVVYGGIIGGTLCAALYCLWKKFYFWDYFDLVLPSVAVAQGFGRIGCFMAGCCYGRATDAWYGIAFVHSNYAPNHVKMIPTQLISSAGMFLIAAVLMFYAKKSDKAGQVGALYMILYSVGRFLVEFLRADYRGEVGPFSTSQFISLFILAVGIGIWIFRTKFAKKSHV